MTSKMTTWDNLETEALPVCYMYGASLNLSSEIIDSIDNKGEEDQDSAEDDTNNDDTC